MKESKLTAFLPVVDCGKVVKVIKREINVNHGAVESMSRSMKNSIIYQKISRKDKNQTAKKKTL